MSVRAAFVAFAVMVAISSVVGYGQPIAPTTSASLALPSAVHPSSSALSTLRTASVDGDKVWICHFGGHVADGTGEIFYDGPDRVIGQEDVTEAAATGCERRGGLVLNVARKACTNGHDAQPLFGTCQGE